MGIFRNLTDFFHKVLRFIALILILCMLILIIKWRYDALYIESTTRSNASFSIFDEVKKIKNDLIATKNGEPIESPIPVVVDDKKDMVTVNISENESVESIANSLLEKDLIKDVEAFKVMVNDMGLYNSFVSGTYSFKKDTKVLDTLMQLTNSTYREYDFEIVEGENYQVVGKKLLNIGAIKSEEAFEQQCKSLGVENSFKPGKYTIATPSKVVRIIEKLTGQTLEPK
ncbi:YceG-like family protein [Peptoniphilus asaccharolyticus DSM 20463]|uniref:YceG-like family protein n=2 Tax=Peptoniphilus asaccharolyticus TaxID=1258 RepID=A0A1W1VCC5_PEPAS|nr:YceG-like family protein [Peptoniphilus asaccharolyticus DSM 20463]